MIYIAAPYNYADRSITQKRIDTVYSVMARLMKEGHYVVSPLLMHEVVIRHDLPNEFEYWREYSINMLKRCDKLIVLMLDGWDTSTGVLAEIEYAEQNNIPVEYIVADEEALTNKPEWLTENDKQVRKKTLEEVLGLSNDYADRRGNIFSSDFRSLLQSMIQGMS